VNPSGETVAYYSGNVIARPSVSKLVPMAMSDPAGRWEVRVKDLLSGQTATSAFEVY
jgi:hypothetical protein